MVYYSDFYTTSRPSRYTPSYSSYTVSKREIPWDKVPFVPRPSLVAPPVTAFGRGRSVPPGIARDAVINVLQPRERIRIRPKPQSQPHEDFVPLYRSARDRTRDRVLAEVHQRTSRPAVDEVLPRLHRLAEQPLLPYKQQILNKTAAYYDIDP